MVNLESGYPILVSLGCPDALFDSCVADCSFGLQALASALGLALVLLRFAQKLSSPKDLLLSLLQLDGPSGQLSFGVRKPASGLLEERLGLG